MNFKIYYLIYLISMLFLNFNNPLIMGIMLLLQTMNVVLIMGKINSYWFSFIIFLVFVGGLFILFIYMISLTYNNKFFSINYKYLYMMILFILFLYMNNFNFIFMKNESKKKLIEKENMINLLKFFNFPNNLINILLIIYLLILMIITVKITNFYKGPLKIKNY